MPAGRASGAPASDAARLRDLPKSRRVLAAFLLGAALSVVGVGAFIASGAAAHGPFTAANPVSVFGGGTERAERSDYRATYSFVEPRATAQSEETHKRHRARITVIGGHADEPRYAGNQPVCVRLCDGYFFPLPTNAANATSQGEACNSLCPDAPTEVFYRNGSDKIEDAISTRGQKYSALPVSLRYRGTSDNTCSCHRDVVAYAPLRDETLRRGDAVMTPAGFMVFRGAEGAKHAPADFAALGASGLPNSQRGALQALEKVSVSPRAPTLRDWLISQANPWPKANSRTLARASTGEDKIRLLVWRGAQD